MIYLIYLMLVALTAGVLASPEPWQTKLEIIREQRNRLSAVLDEVLQDLRPRVEAENPELLPKLEPPVPQAYGYGLLPELIPDKAEVDRLPPSERRYDMIVLADWVRRDQRLAAELGKQVKAGHADVESWIEAYRTRMENFRRIESHISYHALWQKEVHSRTSAWEKKQRLMARYRASNAEATQTDTSELETEFLKFNPKEELKIVDINGARVLRVEVSTDIEDAAFLDNFREAIDRFWNNAEAMKDAHLTIALEWDHRKIAVLYPEGPLTRGSSIDKKAHLARFGPKRLVLTTGVQTTHVCGARAIFVSSARESRHTLAHEFAHLLGFTDRYLRAYERSPGDPNGVALIEIIPYPNDIMGAPGRGKVTQQMVEALFAAYSRQPITKMNISPIRNHNLEAIEMVVASVTSKPARIRQLTINPSLTPMPPGEKPGPQQE